MSPVSTLVLTIALRTATPGDFLAQLAHEGKPLAKPPAHHNRPHELLKIWEIFRLLIETPRANVHSRGA
ncbi:MAG: hypothetical protein U0350_24015 [Caldilineaceae bacterium]